MFSKLTDPKPTQQHWFRSVYAIEKLNRWKIHISTVHECNTSNLKLYHHCM